MDPERVMDTWHNVSHVSKLKKKELRKKGKQDQGREKKGKSGREDHILGGENEWAEREIKWKKKGFSLLYKIYENRAVGFHPSEKKS